MKIVQLLDALDFGDGVSNDVINLQKAFTKLGVENKTYSKWWNERVARYTSNIEQYRPGKEDLIIYHFSGKSYILEKVVRFPCRKLVRYHNVTPPEFFLPDNLEAYQNCREGLEQICKNIKRFSGFWADSRFNASNLVSYGADKQKVDVLPIAFDFDQIDAQPHNQSLLKRLQAPNILSVGRIAPNKRIEDILDVFEAYHCAYDQRVRLYLVGNNSQDASYTNMLMKKLESMTARDHVVFAGKVDSSDLYTYYRAASAYLCLSEHEGFCIPLLEAQHFGVPVIAYASCAVPDTMGEAGILLYKKDPNMAAALLNRVICDAGLRTSIQRKQRENLMQYQDSAIEAKLTELLKKWKV